jgi:DICT domain-containing protein
LPPGQARVSRIVGTMQSIRTASKPILHSMSRHLETQAQTLGETAVLLAIFEHAHFFTGTTKARYEQLAREMAFVGVIGAGMVPDPAEGVRGANIDTHDELHDEWGIAVVAPHFAAAFVARPTGDRSASDDPRQFEFALTYNRENVDETARNMMSKITSHVSPMTLPR